MTQSHLIYRREHNFITEILIQRQHEELCHSGVAHTLSELRKEFWVSKERTKVKRPPVIPKLPETRILGH
ncbi:hypothetical protein X798_05693 [Onchocerca flexuosa]|uniref:Integrase_H2C2 domain-containing protein n=1 Tax=Onchocerca flexuosa TaxID=387005 RepID=A0A238BPQ9_9BILA|nr:hypothetical protein X798_05693 [Onchocerca flexuosa]